MKHFALWGLPAVSLALAAAWLSTRPRELQPSTYGAPDRHTNRAIENVVRNYLLQHPEILPEAFARLQEKETTALLSQVREELETPFYGAVGGNPEGDTTLVVFFDYRCGYCHQAKSKVDQLIDADPNLRVIYRDYPILDAPGMPPMSRMAAGLSLAAAKQNRYVAFYDALFAAPSPITQETLVKAARSAGLNEQAAVSAATSGEVNVTLNRNLEIGRLLGISGTPGFVIGNKVLMGGDKVEHLPGIIAELRS